MAPLGDSHVILNADANALPALINGRLALRHRQPIAHIKPRLHREHHARLQLHMVFAQAVSAHIVHIQPQPMAGAVHVEVPVGPLVDQAIQIASKQTEFHQAFHQHPQGRIVHPFGGLTWSHRGHRGLLGRQHQSIEGPLLATEAPPHREGAGDVAVVVVVEGASRIDQHQVAIAQLGAVGGVVQHAGIVATGHDRAIGRTAGALLEEVLLNHRLHLPFLQAGAGHLPGQFMGFGGDAGGLPHALQLFGPLAQALGVQQRTGRHQAEGRCSAAGRPIELLAPGLEHQGLHLGMAPHPKGNPFCALEVVGQALGELRKGMG